MPASTSSVPYAILIAALVASPSVIARTIHEVTGDPLWRWLAVDEQRLAESETAFEADSPYVQIRVYWRGPDATFETPQEAAAALRRSFAAKGIDSFIAVMETEGDAPADPASPSETTIDIRAGTSRFGPFPLWDAPRHVQPAVLAARLAFRPEATREHRW